MQIEERANAQIERINGFIGTHPSESVVSRLIDYRGRIEAQLTQVQQRDMSVAFIGKIGAGKTSAICKMTGLQTYDIERGVWHDVLKTGAGRTTVCEVRVREADQTCIRITPLDNAEILRIVSNFADFIWAKITLNVSETEEGGSILSQEVTRSIRNMLGLTIETRKNPEGHPEGRFTSTDKALELAKTCKSVEELKESMSGCLNLELRTQTLLQPPAGDSLDHKVWLREHFAKVNDGKLETVSIPALIEVEGPLRLTRGGINWTVIDTRGIDSNVSRIDIREALDADRVVPLICSSFSDAPDANARAVMEMAVRLGIRDRIQRDGVIFVLDKDESHNVPDIPEEFTDKLERKYYGRDIRAQQIRDVLAAELHLHPVPDICFFDSRVDSPEQIWSTLERKHNGFIEKILTEVADLIDASDELINAEESRTKAFEAGIDAVFLQWRQHADKSFPRWKHFGIELRKKFRSSVHHSSLAASIDRNGDYYNFNFYEVVGQIARAAAVDVCDVEVAHIRESLTDLKAEYPEFARRLKAIDDSVVQQMRSYCLDAAELTKKAWLASVGPDKDLWKSMAREWGRGNGYVGRVQGIFGDWIEQDSAQTLHDDILRALTARWGRVLVVRSAE